MSITGHWMAGVVCLDALAALRRAVDPTRFDPITDDVELHWWEVMDHGALVEPARLGYGPRCPTDAAVRFADGPLGLRPDPGELDLCVDALAHAYDGEIFHAAVRKGDPVAALCCGLGFDTARRLPGRAGCFLLDAPAVRAALAEAEDVLEPSRGRDAFTARASRWLDVMGDQPDLDPAVLLDGPLRVLRRARELGAGAVGVAQWY